MKILSEKCGMEEGEVRERYEEFLVQHPEGEISKEEYIGSMKVNYLPNNSTRNKFSNFSEQSHGRVALSSFRRGQQWES